MFSMTLERFPKGVTLSRLAREAIAEQRISKIPFSLALHLTSSCPKRRLFENVTWRRETWDLSKWSILEASQSVTYSTFKDKRLTSLIFLRNPSTRSSIRVLNLIHILKCNYLAGYSFLLWTTFERSYHNGKTLPTVILSFAKNGAVPGQKKEEAIIAEESMYLR